MPSSDSHAPQRISRLPIGSFSQRGAAFRKRFEFDGEESESMAAFLSAAKLRRANGFELVRIDPARLAVPKIESPPGRESSQTRRSCDLRLDAIARNDRLCQPAQARAASAATALTRSSHDFWDTCLHSCASVGSKRRSGSGRANAGDSWIKEKAREAVHPSREVSRLQTTGQQSRPALRAGCAKLVSKCAEGKRRTTLPRVRHRSALGGHPDGELGAA